MPAAVAIPLIVGAGTAATTVYGAKKSADASKDAARTQSASADRAIALQQQMYQQQQQNLAPYRQLGEGSLANLGNFQSFAGVPGAFGAGVQQQYQRPLSPGFSAQAPTQPQGGTLADMGGNYRGSLFGGGPAVRLRAPDGEIKDVPRELAPRLIQMGAVEVQ